MPFIFSSKNSVLHFLEGRSTGELLIMTSSAFVFLGIYLCYLLQNSLLYMVFLVASFYFSPLKILSNCIVVWKISAEKYAKCFKEVALWGISSLFAFKIIFAFYFWSFDCNLFGEVFFGLNVIRVSVSCT